MYSASAVSGSRYYLVADDVSTDGMTEVDNIKYNLTSLGYLNTYSYLPTAATIYSTLPNYYVSVIHGHGAQGQILCKQSGGTTQTLYSTGSTTPALANYAFGSLNPVKLMMFVSCYSALGPSGSTANGFVSVAYNRGAKVTVGFRDQVAGGEWWADYFTSSLSFYSFDSAAYLADANFAYYFPGLDGTQYSPNNPNNQYMLGSIYDFIWNV